jgi:hypothetical protein
MLSLVVALSLLSAEQQEIRGHLRWLGDPALPTTRLAMFVHEDRLDPAKLSPKKFDGQPFEFDWLVSGYAKIHEVDPAPVLRFRVFSQERRPEGDRGFLTARMALRMWEYQKARWDYDHANYYNRGIVDFYLCWGGEAGGEQRFDSDVDGNPPTARPVNTIYIYDINSFIDPVEMAREIAHEYGHATLAQVGGFVEPEDWANGYLGEHLFLRYLRDQMQAGRLEPIDVMGATLPQLDRWVKQNSDPLLLRGATNGPEFGLLAGKGPSAMDAFLALSVYMEAILPPRTYARAFKLIGSQSAKDYPRALVMAAAEREKLVLEIPKLLQGKNLWVPLGARGKVTGADIVKREGDWAVIKPTMGPVVIVNPPLSQN